MESAADTTLNDRQIDILRILNRRERVTVAELTDRLRVSEVTVRKELSRLADAGRLVRVHGGARLAEEPEESRTVFRRRESNLGAKRDIARAAAELVREGETIFLDSGSTVEELARLVADMEVRVVTNSIEVISLLGGSRASVTCIGGGYRAEAGSFVGPLAVRTVREFFFDRCFLGATGITFDGTCSAQNVLEGEVKRAAIDQSTSRVVLADSSKLGNVAFSVFARAPEISLFVVESSPEAEKLAHVERVSSGDKREVLIAGRK